MRSSRSSGFFSSEDAAAFAASFPSQADNERASRGALRREMVQLSEGSQDKLRSVIKINDRFGPKMQRIYAENSVPGIREGLEELVEAIEAISNAENRSLPLNLLISQPVKVFAGFAAGYTIAKRLLSEVKYVQDLLTRPATAVYGEREVGVPCVDDRLVLRWFPSQQAEGFPHSLEGNPIFPKVMKLLRSLKTHLQNWLEVLELCTRELMVETCYESLFEHVQGESGPQVDQTRMQLETSKQLCGFIQRLMELDRKYDPRGTHDLESISNERHRHKWGVVRFCIEQLTTVCILHSLERSVLLWIAATAPDKQEIEDEYFISGPCFGTDAYKKFVRTIGAIINREETVLNCKSGVPGRLVQTAIYVDGKEVMAGVFSVELQTLLKDMHRWLRDKQLAAESYLRRSVQSLVLSPPLSRMSLNEDTLQAYQPYAASAPPLPGLDAFKEKKEGTEGQWQENENAVGMRAGFIVSVSPVFPQPVLSNSSHARNSNLLLPAPSVSLAASAFSAVPPAARTPVPAKQVKSGGANFEARPAAEDSASSIFEL